MTPGEGGEGVSFSYLSSQAWLSKWQHLIKLTDTEGNRYWKYTQSFERALSLFLYVFSFLIVYHKYHLNFVQILRQGWLNVPLTSLLTRNETHSAWFFHCRFSVPSLFSLVSLSSPRENKTRLLPNALASLLVYAISYVDRLNEKRSRRYYTFNSFFQENWEYNRELHVICMEGGRMVKRVNGVWEKNARRRVIGGGW